MDFILKKFVSFFLEPYSLIFVLLTLGFIFLLFNSLKKAKVFIFLSLVCAFLFSYSGFSNMLIDSLENKYKKIENYESIKDIKYVLLLGGDFEARAYEVIKLYQHIDNLKVITSGYKGNDIKTQALQAKEKLIKLGISSEDIIMQEKPRDTIEEAKSIKNIVKDEDFILVTSASHMPRSMKIFNKEGLNPIPAPTGFTVKLLGSQNFLNINELKKTNMALHEYVGILWLNLKAVLN